MKIKVPPALVTEIGGETPYLANHQSQVLNALGMVLDDTLELGQLIIVNDDCSEFLLDQRDPNSVTLTQIK